MRANVDGGEVPFIPGFWFSIDWVGSGAEVSCAQYARFELHGGGGGGGRAEAPPSGRQVRRAWMRSRVFVFAVAGNRS